LVKRHSEHGIAQCPAGRGVDEHQVPHQKSSVLDRRNVDERGRKFKTPICGPKDGKEGHEVRRSILTRRNKKVEIYGGKISVKLHRKKKDRASCMADRSGRKLQLENEIGSGHEKVKGSEGYTFGTGFIWRKKRTEELGERLL